MINKLEYDGALMSGLILTNLCYFPYFNCLSMPKVTEIKQFGTILYFLVDLQISSFEKLSTLFIKHDFKAFSCDYLRGMTKLNALIFFRFSKFNFHCIHLKSVTSKNGRKRQRQMSQQ